MAAAWAATVLVAPSDSPPPSGGPISLVSVEEIAFPVTLDPTLPIFLLVAPQTLTREQVLEIAGQISYHP